MATAAAIALSTLALLTVLPSTARADCILTGSTVTCAPPGTGGFTAATDGLTVTVQSGATVTVTGAGNGAITVNNTSTVTNNGTISGGDDTAGILATDGNTIVNNGSIATGANGAGVSAGNRNTVTNAGQITVGDGGSGFGIAVGFNGTVVNSGSITVGQGATGIAADNNGSLPVSNSVTNSGSIIVGTFGTGIIVTNKHRILNSGTISGDSIIGIKTDNNSVVTNTGTISTGASGTGVEFAHDGNTLFNYGTITATGANGATIFSCSCTNNNVFNNMAGGTLDGRLTVDGAGNTLNNSGLLIVTDAGTPIGYPTFLIANQFGLGAGNTFMQTSTGTLALRMDNTGAIDNLTADAIVPGGTVKIVIQPQLYPSQTFSGTAISALGAPITAPFAHYTASSPFFTVTPFYDSNDPTNYQSITFELDRLPFGAVPGATDNQRAVGNALEAGYSTSLTGTLATFYSNLLAVSSLDVLDQLSGSGTAAAQNGAFGASGLFNDTMTQQGLAWINGTGGGGFGAPLPYASADKPEMKPGYEAFAAMRPRAPKAPEWRAWALGFGSTRSIDGSGGTAGQSVQTAGGAFGVERVFGGDVLLGLGAGGSKSNFSASGLSTSGSMDGGHVGGYVAKRWGDLYALATINYAHFDNTTDRTIAGVGATEYAHGRFGSDQLGGRFELGWRRRIAGYNVTPFVAVEPSTLWQQAYTETSATATGSAGILGLSYAARETTSLPTFAGAQLDTTYMVGGHTVRPFLRAAWVHEFMPARQISASFVSIPSPSFTVDGARPASDAGRFSGGLTWTIDASKAVFARVDSEFSGSGTMVAGTAGARISW
ncbi:MAG TPA: autotransporter domain-containing protein [Pseudolabrys sp.]|nr:autotransporter domain-containing protein [Pseudolabrys sp.]